MKTPPECPQGFECELAAHVAAFAPILPLAPSRLALLAERVAKETPVGMRLYTERMSKALIVIGVASSVGLDPVHFLDSLEWGLGEDRTFEPFALYRKFAPQVPLNQV